MPIHTIHVGNFQGTIDVCGSQAEGLKKVEVGDTIVRLGKGSEDIIANTIEHGQLGCDLPGVLDEEAWLPGAIVGSRDVHLALLTAESTGQSGRDTVVAL